MKSTPAAPSGTLRSTLAAALLVAVAGLLQTATAADTPEPAPVAAPDPLAPARGHIAGGRYGAAIEALRKANASGSADWNNLMGYAQRKHSPPDLDAAQRHYDAALRIDPRHLGALAYAGELALMKGDLPTAEARLARLARLCSSPCEALDELQQAIAGFKANGNRYR